MSPVAVQLLTSLRQKGWEEEEVCEGNKTECGASLGLRKIPVSGDRRAELVYITTEKHNLRLV